MSQAYVFHRRGRDMRTAVIVGAILLALLLAWALLDAALWVVAIIALFTLPALRDLLIDPPSGLTLSDTDLSWHSGNRRGTVALSEIDLVRLDTRLDFSVRGTLVLENGQKIRLPFEATPPHERFEKELNNRGLTTRRTHFQLFQ